MPKVTQAHRDARKQQILEAARAVFAERGFAQTSTGDIVARSGLSTGAVYSYYPSKHDLVLAVCDTAVDSLFGDDAHQDLSGLLERVRAGGPEHASLMAQVWGEAAVSPELAGRIRDQLAALRAKVADLVRGERAHRGLPDDPDPAGLANALLALLTGHSLRLAVGDDSGAEAFSRAIRAIVEAPAPGEG
ncbi:MULTISPECIES: TetR/AcrR family transcriptional regulator [unclassified Streptomyces]|uniref:TetR/AcrR family transcriptional regulator n=1 Tax=unclassified Streptomyces TaxID=2593676 RepID=UPI00110FA649|nr:TetR/AcrR family transcriptional regulator [Streptomyces sp. DASNCL29]TMU98168.1 TetR/AcrR family transcriptional regulator [Streptomyces sp. DASNCL29]